MPNSNKPRQLKQQFKELHSQTKKKLADTHPLAWDKVSESSTPIGHLISKTKHAATTAAVAGTLMTATTPVILAQPVDHNVSQNDSNDLHVTKPSPPTHFYLQNELKEILPQYPHKLTETQSSLVNNKLKSILNINAVTKLDGFDLNTDYGFMGAEQHMPRFPGDTIWQHDEIQASGITASRGAFGYFAPSKAAMTEENVKQEKYYVAVQSFLSPSWKGNSREFKKWLKFRKVLVVNPNTGRAIVAVVGDAGPAKWTGKHFGGSPEIIRHINNGQHRAKTTVLLLFVDDPHNQVPLGPVN